MRTIVAPLGTEVEEQLGALDAKRAEIARRYIRRLVLEPLLGSPVARGPLAGYSARRVYFDADSVPGDLLRCRAPAARRGMRTSPRARAGASSTGCRRHPQPTFA